MILRLLELERRVTELSARLAKLKQDVTQAAQSTGALWGQMPGNTATGATSVYHIPAASAGVIAAGGSGTADVWQTVGGTNSLLVSGATIYNVMGAATVASKVIMVGACGDGTYKVISQSCV